MELKTLKDLQDKVGRPHVWADELKQEAIKWVKKIRSLKYPENLCLVCDRVYEGNYCHNGHTGEQKILEHQTGTSTGAELMMIKFHNITEEDLK